MFRRCARRLAAAGLLVFAGTCAPALAQDPPPAPPPAPAAAPMIAQDVFAAGVDLSGLTAEQAAAKLDKRLGAQTRRTIVVLIAGRRFTLPGADAKLRIDAAATAKDALKVAAGAPDPGAGGVAPGRLVALHVSHARLVVAAFAERVAAAVRREPRNATVRLGLRHQRLRRARLGHGANVPALRAAVDAALDALGGSRRVRARVHAIYPQVNANDLRSGYGTIVTVEKRSFRLRVFKRLRLSKSYPVAVGQPAYPTPEGTFQIQDKQIDPVWSVPNSPWAGELGGTTVAGGSLSNPLKARWMGVTDGVGIHGTGEDYSIGSAASHGCIRMHVADVKDLYPRVPVGATVVIG